MLHGRDAPSEGDFQTEKNLTSSRMVKDKACSHRRYSSLKHPLADTAKHIQVKHIRCVFVLFSSPHHCSPLNAYSYYCLQLSGLKL